MFNRIRLEQVVPATNTYKAYEIVMEKRADGWAVSGWNGRIGAPLKEQPKGTGMEEADAKAVFDKLLKTQIKKGYKPAGEATEMVAVPESLEIDPEMIPALPTALLDRDDVDFVAGAWLVQEKFDGENRPARITAENVELFNRTAQPVPVPAHIHDALCVVFEKTGNLRFESEDMGADGLVIFDVPEGLGVVRADGFAARNELGLKKLDRIIADLNATRETHLPLRVSVAVPYSEFVATGGEARLRADKAEGFVAKRADAPHTSGRNTNPKKAAMVKVKFVEDATFRIAASREKGKRSVGLESWDADAGVWVRKGNVTIPVNADIPAVGTFADVCYLYAYAGGSVIQPTWKGPRDGVTPEDCAVSKLKLKRAPAAGAEADDEA